MSDLEIFFYYFAERGAYLLPMNLVLITIFSVVFINPLKSKNIGNKKLHFIYFLSASIITSIFTYIDNFAGSKISIIEVPLFVLSGITIIYVCYIPIYWAMKYFKRSKKIQVD